MKITLNENTYTVVKYYREGYKKEEVEARVTEYFTPYDYIFGDWAYGKLRLKGFYKSDHKNVKPMNDIKSLEQYIKNNCAYDCRYFLLEKEESN